MFFEGTMLQNAIVTGTSPRTPLGTELTALPQTL